MVISIVNMKFGIMIRRDIYVSEGAGHANIVCLNMLNKAMHRGNCDSNTSFQIDEGIFLSDALRLPWGVLQVFMFAAYRHVGEAGRVNNEMLTIK